MCQATLNGSLKLLSHNEYSIPPNTWNGHYRIEELVWSNSDSYTELILKCNRNA